ncbi:MAG: cysteinyl-tRNA synthetase [Candidatus Parcubacteria bacterium]
MLHLYNSASRTVEAVSSLVPGRIGMYACGPTVYQAASIGNLRSFMMEDVLRRTLEHLEGFHVRHVVNITDVGHLVGDGDAGDDKMEKSAREQGKDAWEISRSFTQLFLTDLERMHILMPTVMPKATDHIADQIELVRTLEEKGFTYRTSDGIYFDTKKFPAYGHFSGQRLEEKEEGARVEVNAEKRNPTDFALWKFSGSGPKRQMEWESPWGIGFPGWHAECSAMARTELGQPFDIHCGGIDLIPVHHENEIAQSVAAYGVPLATHWMHVEFVLVDGQKMSKSLKNTYTLDDLMARGISPEAYRLFLLGAHYRSKQNFTWEAVAGAQHAWEKIQRIVRAWDAPTEPNLADQSLFREAMEDDLNTPKALAVFWEVLQREAVPSADRSATVLWMDQILGLGLSAVVSKPILIPMDIKQLADLRQGARTRRDWAEADRLRDALKERGWEMQDGTEGYHLSHVS